MKKSIFLTVLMIFGLALFSGCATMHTWPDQERSAENKMVTIEQKIGEGLKTGALSPDQAQMFLTSLKSIRIDFTALRNTIVYREQWDSLHHRLDVLGDEIDRSLVRTSRMDEPRGGDRIAALQRRIDDGRVSGRLSRSEEREFQVRLDSIRSEYLRMSDRGRHPRYEARTDISRRLDSLEMDLDRYR